MKFLPIVMTALLSLLLSNCSHSSAPGPLPATEDQPLTIDSQQPLSSRLSADAVTSTAARIGIAHIFDNGITTSQIASYPNRYDVIWGSFNPGPWRAANPSALVSLYYILEEDNVTYSKRTLAWWQANHPDWILYACTASGSPTKEVAYTPGVGFADIPLDIHNPSVVSYQQRTSLIPYVLAHGYNAIALDEVVLSNIMLGGNPRLGQSVIPGYYGCGIWEGTKFVRRYASKSDPAWTADVLNWVKTLHTTLKTDATIAPHHLALVINHPANSVNANEVALLGNTDVDLNETGYSDYGYYTEANRAGYFAMTVAWTNYAQAHGVRVITTDKYTTTPSITTSQIDYALATYLMANQGLADLVIAGKTYSVQPYYTQFATSVGSACGAMYGGPSYDRSNPHIYYRRFNDGIAVVNSGSLPRTSEVAHLPKNHIYKDVLGRAVSSTMSVGSSDAYTMTTPGSGCI